MKISDNAFESIFKNLTLLEKVDLSECELLREKSLIMMFSNNKNFKEIQISNSPKAVTDTIMQNISNLKSQLVDLDISYSTYVTD